MQIDRLDHLVLTVRDIDASIDFYTRVLGMRAVTFGAGRKALAFGAQKINLHQAGGEFEPKAERPTPGSADLCFIVATPLEAVAEQLRQQAGNPRGPGAAHRRRRADPLAVPARPRPEPDRTEQPAVGRVPRDNYKRALVMTDYTQQLAGFLAGLRYQDLPPAVLARMEELFLDWLGSALAGKGQHPIPLFERYAERMGPADGSAQILPSRRRSSPYFAALVNGAASHVVEQDDLHNSSVLHPAAVVFPAALAAAQDLGRSGAELILAAVAGYEAGIRIGEFLGRSHYRVFHTTATVGTLAAAVAVGKLMDFDRERFVDLLGSAGTQAAGLWEFLRDAADSKQLHTAKAAADGLLAAYLTADGLSGARHILEGEQGMAAGMSSDADPERLVDRLGSRWALLETSFKFHASCRHTHPAADAAGADAARRA